MEGDEYIRGKSIEDLLSALYTDAQPNSRVWEQIRMAVIARSAQDVAKSIREYSASNTRLSGQLLWLNITLGVFTVVGTVLAVWALVAQHGA
jgi:hypothetical protein